jgi:hypothetical protein
VFAGAFAAPILGWAGVVTIVVGHFYSHDSEVYRQFVWMLDSLRSGGPSEWATDVGRNTLTFLRTAASWDVIPVLLVGGILLACCYSLRRVRRARRPLAELELALLIVTISVAAFLWLMGFYETRLTFAIVPTLSMLVAVQLERLRAQLRWWHGVVAAAMAVLWVGAHIVRPGPYS